MNTANSRTSGLPTALRLAGKSLRISYSFAAPPLLSPQPRLLRSTRDRAGRIDSRYWKLARSGRYRFAAVDTGTFDLDAARAEVTCHLLPGFSGGEVEEILRGPVCAFFLLERGFEPLHASGISLDGRCIAFAGNPGAGKSSLVAWMSRHGAQFVCDDILPLRESRGSVCAHPGLAQILLSLRRRKNLAGKIGRSFQTPGENCGRTRSVELPRRAAHAQWQEFISWSDRRKGRPAALRCGGSIRARRSARSSSPPATTRWRRRSACAAKCACSRSWPAPSLSAACSIRAALLRSRLYLSGCGKISCSVGLWPALSSRAECPGGFAGEMPGSLRNNEPAGPDGIGMKQGRRYNLRSAAQCDR